MGLRDANASNDRRYNWTKMFGTIARNEKGDPTDPCAGDSGDFFCLFLQEDPFQNIRSPPAMLIKRQSNPGGPLVWKSPASRSVLVGTVQGGGFDCRFWHCLKIDWLPSFSDSEQRYQLKKIERY